MIPAHIKRDWLALPQVASYRKQSRQMARDILRTDPVKGRAVLRMIRAAEQRSLQAYYEAKVVTVEVSDTLN